MDNLPEPNLEKLKQLTHYIISECQNKESFGKTVLFKLLYFSDFNYFKKNFVPITNERYKKLKNGPAPIHFDKILKMLVAQGLVSYEIKEYSDGKEWYKFKSLTKSNPTLLKEKELKEIERVISKIGSLNASEISKLSHEDNPWKSTPEGKIINYRLVFYRDKNIENKVE